MDKTGSAAGQAADEACLNAPPGERHGLRRMLKFYGRIAGIGALALPGIALQRLFLRLDLRLQATFPMVFHRYVSRVLDIRRIVRGCPVADRPLMLVANHVSWLDIIVLSAVAPVSFIAKSEVESWGVFGLFARLQRSVFVNRERRTDTGAVNGSIAERLRRGDVMVLFAEGTTGDGVRLQPFRSALLGAARAALTAGDEVATVWLQPVSIAYTGLGGLPSGRFERPHTAWYGDMTLPPHLRAILSGASLDVTISFGTPQPFRPDSDRKRLTRILEDEVRSMTILAHMGRSPVAKSTPPVQSVPM